LGLTETEIGQLILAVIAVLGFSVQIWRDEKSSWDQRQRNVQQTKEITLRIELARAQLAAVTAEAHAAADRAYREANTVNEKIHAVGTGIIKLVEASDPTEAAELSRALIAAEEVARKKNGGDNPTP